MVPCDLSISKVAEVFNVSEHTARQACELKIAKRILSIPERKQRADISQEIKQTVLAFYKIDEINCLLSGKKDRVNIGLQDKPKIKRQKRLLLSNISEI